MTVFGRLSSRNFKWRLLVNHTVSVCNDCHHSRSVGSRSRTMVGQTNVCRLIVSESSVPFALTVMSLRCFDCRAACGSNRWRSRAADA